MGEIVIGASPCVGLFTIQEIESIIEEGYSPTIRRRKLQCIVEQVTSREALSKMNTKAGSKAQDKSGKINSAIFSKERERFCKIADIKMGLTMAVDYVIIQ